MWGENHYLSEDVDYNSACNGDEIHLYHVCTKGLESRLLFHDAIDYQRAVNMLAIVSYSAGIHVFAYCLMTNHLHAVIGAAGKDVPERFILTFKKEYSQYYSCRYKADKVFRHVGVTVKSIGDIPYLRNCIAYVLRNPVDGGLTKAAEQYEWSSIGCYFTVKSTEHFVPLSEMGVKQIKHLLATHRNVRGSRMMLDENGGIVPASFVENIFNESSGMFWTKIQNVNTVQMEFDLALSPSIHYNDYEVIGKISRIAEEWFHKASVSELSTRERCKIAGYMRLYLNSGIPQISRLLGLDRNVVRDLICSGPTDDR